MLGGGYISYRGGVVLRVGEDWLSWPDHYSGDVIWTGYASPSARLNVGGLSAFGIIVEPRRLEREPITFTLSNGQSITRYVDGGGGGQFFGFVGDGVSWIRLDDAANGSFAVGEVRFVNSLAMGRTSETAADSKTLVAAVISGDLVANTYQVQITGDGGDYNDAGLTFNANGNQEYCYGTSGEPENDDCVQGQTNLVMEPTASQSIERLLHSRS